jgi:hypothetical protein
LKFGLLLRGDVVFRDDDEVHVAVRVCVAEGERALEVGTVEGVAEHLTGPAHKLNQQLVQIGKDRRALDTALRSHSRTLADTAALTPAQQDAWRVASCSVEADDTVVLTVVSGESEAEVVCGLLRSAGIECGYRDTDAIDSSVEDFIAAGPREILVREADLAAAKELLAASQGSSE